MKAMTNVPVSGTNEFLCLAATQIQGSSCPVWLTVHLPKEEYWCCILEDYFLLKNEIFNANSKQSSTTSSCDVELSTGCWFLNGTGLLWSGFIASFITSKLTVGKSGLNTIFVPIEHFTILLDKC